MKWHLSTFEALALAPCDVAADGFTLSLRKAAEEAQRHFTGHLHCVDALFFKNNGDTLCLELADISDGIQRVSGKPGDGFGQHHVDFTFFTQCHELEKLGTLFGAGSGDALIGKNTGKLPILVFADFIGIISNLRSVAGLLFFLFGTDPAVGRHTQLSLSGIGLG